jgi:hypothetical protein
MCDFDDTETATLKNCRACRAEMIDSDRFCRRCGACQHTSEMAAHSSPLGATTRLLDEDSYHSISGPLIKAVARGVSIRISGPLCSRLAIKAVLALVSVPIWMMIVLLSPIDAYLAAKDISARAACR